MGELIITESVSELESEDQFVSSSINPHHDNPVHIPDENDTQTSANQGHLQASDSDSLLDMTFENESKASSVSTLPAPSSMSSIRSAASSKGGATLEMERLQKLVTDLLNHEYGSEFSTPLNMLDFPGYNEAEAKNHPCDLGSILR